MKNKINCIIFAAIIIFGALLCLFLPKSGFSESERRVLATLPEFSAENVFSGSFSENFEEYAADNFPFRDSFRTIKAYTSYYLLGLSDNNGLFAQDGHISKIEYPQNTPMLDHAAEKFEYINDSFISKTDADVYLSVVPDKSFFLDTLSLDYEAIASYMSERMPYAEYIDIFETLSLSDYYTTDSHWRQEKISKVAEKISQALGCDLTDGYSVKELDIPFYGVYSGQSALVTAPDRISYITNDMLSDCVVKKYDSGKPETAYMYDFEKAEGRDPYEFFLSGNSAILTIENPEETSGRELIIFRDSFASSLTHYLVGGYSKITLADIRYVRSDMLASLVDFANADEVLFLYSASLLNNSLALK